MSIRPLAHVSVGVLGLALASAGCQGPGSNPGPVACMADNFPADAGTPAPAATLTLIVGTESNGRVPAAWQDGDRVPLVTGGQGGFMIRPALDITAPAPLIEDAAHATCLGVRMVAGGGAMGSSVLGGVSAPRIAGTTATYHVAPLFGLLAYNGGVDGVAIPVTFDAHAPGFDGHAQVTVIPDSTLSH